MTVAAARRPPAGKVGSPKTGKKLFLTKGLRIGQNKVEERFVTIPANPDGGKSPSGRRGRQSLVTNDIPI